LEESKISKPFLFIIGFFISIPLIYYFGLYALSLMDPRFTLNEMDLNNDGFVSPSEADYVSSSGEREIFIKGKKCMEYFAYKDGLPIKVECNETAL